MTRRGAAVSTAPALAVAALAVAALAVAALATPRAAAVPRDAPRCDVAGTWDGDGRDDAGTRWTWTLVVTQQGTALAGAFAWHGSNGDVGRENVHGTVDCTTRRFRLDGHSLEHVQGALALGDYAGAFDASFARLSGRWTNGVPGTFRGARRAR